MCKRPWFNNARPIKYRFAPTLSYPKNTATIRPMSKTGLDFAGFFVPDLNRVDTLIFPGSK